jgi:hypothetical protein
VVERQVLASPLLLLDATMKVREAGRAVNTVVLVATGVNGDGHREVIGVKVATSETKETWNVFFADIVAQGLSGVQLVTSDAHAGPGGGDRGESARRCLAALPYSLRANLMSVTPKSAWGGVKAMLHSVDDQPDAAAVNAQFDKLIDTVAGSLPAVEHLDAPAPTCSPSPHGQPGQQHALAAEPVGEAAERQHQRGEDQVVSIHHPLQLGGRGVQLAHHGGQRHVHQRRVQVDRNAASHSATRITALDRMADTPVASCYRRAGGTARQGR